MKPIGIFYATREGHTKLIAERVAIALRTLGLGLRAETHDLRVSPVELGHYDAAILAASVHAGSHEAEMLNFVKQHRAQLDAMPNAFLSVTLSQVGVEDLSRPPADRARFAADVESVLENFRGQTGWNPKQGQTSSRRSHVLQIQFPDPLHHETNRPKSWRANRHVPRLRIHIVDRARRPCGELRQRNPRRQRQLSGFTPPLRRESAARPPAGAGTIA